MKISTRLLGVFVMIAVTTLATTGCARRKYVRKQVEQVDQRVTAIDKQHTEAETKLDDKYGKEVSRVEEKAGSADNHAGEAGTAAQQADQHAGAANESAQTAQQLGQRNQATVNDVTQAFNNRYNYKVVSTEDVLFGFDKADLTQDAKSKIDTVISIPGDKNAMVYEVEGFTDRSGPSGYNLALSRRRADAVVRYLVSHNIPLRRIHMIGLGEEARPSASTGAQTGQADTATTTEQSGQTAGAQPTRVPAKELRKVTIRAYAPEATSAGGSASQTAP